jgi:nicotinamide mononucleotide transporter
MQRIFVVVGSILSLCLLIAAWMQWTTFSFIEAVGFVTGAACVFLVIKENIWNFPIGIVNNLFFLILFTQARLFGDAGLQIVYVGLGMQGWYQWLRGGKNHTELKMSKATPTLILLMILFVIVGTAGLIYVLGKVNGSAPLLDSFTTALSLAAQFLLNRKTLENWFFWMFADVIYVFLYVSRGLHLTAIFLSVRGRIFALASHDGGGAWLNVD